jgi:uncharacterized membrane protein
MTNALVTRSRRGARDRDEGGAVLIISVLYLVVTVISCALAVDLGGLAQTARDNQKIADLAALDAVRVLPSDPTSAAVASAARNGYTASGSNFTVECATSSAGPFNTGLCTSGTGTVVKVTVSSTHTNTFPYVGPSQAVARSAKAQGISVAGFSLGSALARVDATVQAPLFGRVLEKWLGSNTGSITVTAAGYTGIASSYVTLGNLATQLGFGTVNQLLAANLTVKQILQATATVLSNNGNAASVDVTTIYNTIAAAGVGNTTNIKLGDMIILGTGGASNAANAGINVMQLLSGSAELANKSSFISVPNAMTNVTVPNVGTVGTTLGLKVIEGPKIYIGPVTTTPKVTTSQIDVTFTSTISNLQISLPGIALLKANGTLQTVTSGAKAQGTLANVTCSGPSEGISVKVDTDALTTSVSSPSGALALTTLLGVGVGSIDVNGNATGASNSQTLSFLYPGEFSPTATSKQTNSAPLNTTVTGTTAGNVTLLGVNFSNATVASAVLTSAKPLLDQIAVQLKSKELAALGVSLGIADVAALKDAFIPSSCGQPGLIG